MTRVLYITLTGVFAIALYLLFWPIKIEPVAWEAPVFAGLEGPFQANQKLQGVERISIGPHQGPEYVALDHEGNIYCGTEDGSIVRLLKDGSRPETWINTQGRPLGLDFDQAGNLIVADAFRGLLKITPSREIIQLVHQADDVPVIFANSVQVARDGKIYFTDSTTGFDPEHSGGTFKACVLDIFEHGSQGRLLVYNPQDRQVTTILNKLNFANGLALAPDQTYLLITETSQYRILRYWLAGEKQGQVEYLFENLPGFPDNLSVGLEGMFWVSLFAPRNTLLDKLADKPFLRKIIQRLPAFLKPEEEDYSHVFAFDAQGNILVDLQNPHPAYLKISGVTETKEFLYMHSVEENQLGRIRKKNITE